MIETLGAAALKMIKSDNPEVSESTRPENG